MAPARTNVVEKSAQCNNIFYINIAAVSFICLEAQSDAPEDDFEILIFLHVQGRLI